jgi:hypothetical protein
MTDYETIYKQLMSKRGREELGDDPLRQEKMVDKIQEFLDKYPTIVPPEKDPNTPWVKLPVQVIYKRTLQTAIDVIVDMSTILSQKEFLSSASFRRKLVLAFTREDRRLYIGIWLIFLSFVIYFIDSAA